MDTSTKNEEQFIEDIKKSIANTSLNVSEKVIKSAYTFLVNKNYIVPDKTKIAKQFMTTKIPQVIAKELSSELNKVLGLNLDIK